MAVAALILGIIGGIIGLIVGGVTLAFGGVGAAFDPQAGAVAVIAGWWVLGLSVVGIVGAAIAQSRPRLGGVLMLAGAIGGVTFLSAAYWVPGALLGIGGLLALFARRTRV